MDIASWNLEGNADAVEFCPHDSFHHILAAATYTLEEGTQPNRSGTISIFSTSLDSDLQLLHHLQTAAVFDLKWNPTGSTAAPFLAQADADGNLSLYTLHDEPTSKSFQIGKICAENIASDSMCLFLDWNPSSTSIVVAISNGSISRISIGEAKMSTLQSWIAHDYEVWTTIFDAGQPHVLYSGSNDCSFAGWDSRESPSALSVFRNVRSHRMGVCCIAQNPFDSNKLVTGSYDEELRVWDLRSMVRPVNEYSICLGGGVWRAKFHPNVSGLVLVACMHNGFAVVRLAEEDATVVESYGKHGSLAYGADWQRGGCGGSGSGSGGLVATCSFYDRLLRVWRPESLMVK